MLNVPVKLDTASNGVLERNGRTQLFECYIAGSIPVQRFVSTMVVELDHPRHLPSLELFCGISCSYGF